MEIINKNDDRQVLSNVKVGENVKIYHFVNAYGCEIGDGSKIGTFVEIQKRVTIGKNCKISSHTFICEGVSIGDGTFVGHNVSFINDKYPLAVNPDGSLQTADDWNCIDTEVGKQVSIGTSATILCGVKIGDHAMIGAGAVVTKDVEPHAIVAGNPAKFIRYANTKHTIKG